MSPRALLVVVLMKAILTKDQKESLQAYLQRLDAGLPISKVAVRQVRSIALANKLIEPEDAPKGAKSGGLDGGDFYSSHTTQGTAFAEKVLSHRPSSPPGRRKAG